jgi:thymidylate kinase
VTLLAIDGPAGAGKTTLAAQFEAEFSQHSTVKTIHMDDLYNGWDHALTLVLTDLLSRIAQAHLSQDEFVIDKFNWTMMSFDVKERILPTDILILEGVGSAQHVIRATGAATYWLDISPEIGLQRVLNRDGAHLEAQMRKWQIQQDVHFLKDQTRENCNFNLSS